MKRQIENVEILKIFNSNLTNRDIKSIFMKIKGSSVVWSGLVWFGLVRFI